ncbi:capsule biosynthesis protein [Amylibacter sp. SFDW26]|uniref:capsule biosynthesis protein n=1 Tax=Amylibacter sp. SFDW26 TaxID=2652722 RepID=UPI00186ABBEB|nr:capsule biosynthesis protein CapA [Amylibacter sp. SFDW26]
MKTLKNQDRSFLFLQGPHGPFQYEFSKRLVEKGVSVHKICFNAGDRFFWRNSKTRSDFTGKLENWPEYIQDVLQQGYTDLVVYGDNRRVHVDAVKCANDLGITIHYLEEGYLRPYWATYEREGVNGDSCLLKTSIEDMRKDMDKVSAQQPSAPVRWGDMRQHILLGAVYHWHILFWNKDYPNYVSHRDNSVRNEFQLHLVKILNRIPHAIQRRFSTKRLVKSGVSYHLGILQLSHDASIRRHSKYTGMDVFMRECVEAFAKHAPKHHHLVFKAHPLEDERKPLAQVTTDLSKEFNVDGRIHYIRGGKLAQILDFASSVVTINSTAAQQALWRGLPIKTMGTSVYDRPEFTSSQDLGAFFANPKKPDLSTYRDYRQYLLATSQVPGGFYSRVNRQRLLLQLVDLVLEPKDTYNILKETSAAPVQQSMLGTG